MMPLVHQLILAVSSSLPASIIAKATVTMALGLICAWLFRGSRAAVRHALLAASFGVLLLLPVVSVVAPAVRIVIPAGAEERMPPASAKAAMAIPPAARAHAGVDVTPAAPRSAGLSPALLLAGWLAGATLFLSPLVLSLWQVRSLRRSARPWRHGQSVADKLAICAGIHRPVEVLLHGSLPGPITCGVMHPAIVLPHDAETWDEANLNRALVHELEHVGRADRLSQSLARAVCGAYWFHPLVWMAWRGLVLEAERSCDDAVLRRSEAADYADQLVGLARRLSTAAKPPLPAMANRADLAARVGALLDSRQRRGRAGTLPVALACAAAAALVLTVSPLRIVAAPQSASADSPPAHLPRFRAATLLVIADVTVSDQSGNPVEGLSARDFVLTEDGVAQAIGIFEYQKQAAGGQSLKPYYVLGYYTAVGNADGEFRNIQITGKQSAMARLDYRAGFYPRHVSNLIASEEPGRGGVDPASPGVTPPVVLSKTDAEYSDEARKAKYQGLVLLSVEVDATGRVAIIKVLRSLGLGLDEKAIAAVKLWKFKPGIKDGKPVSTQSEVEVNFRLL